MRVSALIPTYNRRPHVLRAIDSILAQTRPVDELIIVDDGSIDGTADAICSRYEGTVRVIRQANTGVCGARLRAVQEAQGEWIAFLDSDDEWLPDRQEELATIADRLPPDVAWLFGDLRIMTDQGEGPTLFGTYGLSISKEVEIFDEPFPVLFPHLFPMFQSSWIRRQALLEARCFQEKLRVAEDFLASFQVACRYRFAGVPSVVTRLYRTSDLRGTSLFQGRTESPDHYRSQMMACSLAMQKTGKRSPWAQQYAGAARSLCSLQAAQGQPFRRLAFEQFRRGPSGKAAAFVCAAMLGRPGLKMWNALARATAPRAPRQRDLLNGD